jgi:hypothetical protein
MTTTPRTRSVSPSSQHPSQSRYLASAVAVATPLLFFGAGTAPAYADDYGIPGPVPVVPGLIPIGDPIIADFAPMQPPGFDSPEAAHIPGPVIADYLPPAPPVIVTLGPDNPYSRDYVPGIPIPLPLFPMP